MLLLQINLNTCLMSNTWGSVIEVAL